MKQNRPRHVVPLGDAVAGARTKLAEAAYFLRLMDRLERQQKPLVEGNDFKQEYSFYLSACLSACFSVSAHLYESVDAVRATVKKFRQEHDAFYARGAGWRHVAVHLRPVEPEYHGHISPPGDSVILRLSDEPYTPPTGNKVALNLDKGRRFYFTAEGPQNSIGDLCAVHLGALRRFVDQCVSAHVTKGTAH